MRKIIPLSLLNVVSLFAAEVSQGEMQSIYFEAVLFIGVFGTMGLISYIYSNRHAKAYSVSKEAIERREKEKVREKKKKVRIQKLSAMLKEELITQEEFAVLHNHYS